MKISEVTDIKMSRWLYSIIVALVLCATQPFTTYAQGSAIGELSNNEEYVSLMRRSSELNDDLDSITRLMNDVRNSFRDAYDAGDMQRSTRDSFSNRIIELEQEMFNLRDERGIITNRIIILEKEWVLSQFSDPQPSIPSATDEVEEDGTEQYRNLIDNRCFVTTLQAEDYDDLRQAHNEEIALEQLAKEYIEHHNRISECVDAYMTTDNEAIADSLFTVYNEMTQRASSLDEAIKGYWNHILDAKYYSYGYILEKNGHYEPLDDATDDFLTYQKECSEYDGYYASDNIMHYALGRERLLDYEVAFAEKMGLSAAADSLKIVRESLQLPEYRLQKHDVERRLFLDYQPITFGKTTFYNSSNPLPDIKIYELGTIYRIRLGKFRAKQNMSLFKGVQPLYLDRDEDGNYLYYAGGYATHLEADEAVTMLRNKGFKSPQICRWEDGEMINLSDEAKKDSDTPRDIPVVGNRYMVNIEATELSSDLQATIDAVASGKRISRVGNTFAVGTFTKLEEAEALVQAIEQLFPDITLSIKEIELN